MKKTLTNLAIAIVCLSNFPSGLLAQTTLNTGDIVLLAFNGDGEYSPGITQDGYSFMPLVNLEAGTEIFFTDIGWSNEANAFISYMGNNDMMIKYTAPTAIAAGTIIRNDEMNTIGFTAYSSNTTYTTAFFEVFFTGNSTGDEILVFQGSRANPTFIFAASQRPVAWDSNIPANGADGQGSGSALPPGLIDDVTALSLPHFDNYAYTGSISPATKAEWKSRIGNPANWTGDDTNPTILNSGSYTVTDAPLLNTLATVTTQEVTSITSTTAVGNGNITVLGVPNPTQYGVVWSTSANPTVELTTKTTQGEISTTGAFTSSITDLTANTTYYVKAYATNTAGTSYGEEVSFKTDLGTDVSNYSGNASAIFPNPATDGFVINSEAETSMVAVYDISGCLLISQQVDKNSYVDISSLPKGVYLVKANALITKLIKK